MKTNVKHPQAITDIALAADAAQRGRMQLFSQTELAKIPHTAENIAKAVQAVKLLTSQTRSLLEMSTVQRGMYLCWLKANYTQHGEWETFCKEHFEDVPKRTRCYWMSAYLTAIGEKKPKELPAYDPADLESDELSDAVERLSTDKSDLAPRGALIEHIKKLQSQIDKGMEQRRADRERIEQMEAALHKAQQGACIPAHITDEATRVEHVRNSFWSFVTSWMSSLPTEDERLRLHLALYTELKEAMLNVWHEHLGPQIEAKKAKGRKGK